MSSKKASKPPKPQTYHHQRFLDAAKIIDVILSEKGAPAGGFHQVQKQRTNDIISWNADDIRWSEESSTLIMRRRDLTKQQLGTCHSSATGVPLSALLACMDEQSSLAFILADPNNRSGVSVSLRMEWVRPELIDGKDTIDVTFYSTLTKIGQRIGFCRAEVRTSETNELICWGSHIKYVSMGYWADMILSETMYPFMAWFMKRRRRAIHQDLPSMTLEQSLETFQYDPSLQQASIQVDVNRHASAGGNMHGGCQAVIHECSATSFVRDQWPSEDFELETISIDYLSSPHVGVAVMKPRVVNEIHEPQSVVLGKRLTVVVELITMNRCNSIGTAVFRQKSSCRAAVAIPKSNKPWTSAKL